MLNFMLAMAPAMAQDKLITKDGDVIEAFRIDIGGSSIYYRLEDSDNAELKSIKKDDVLMIKKNNGERVPLYNKTETPSANITQKTEVSENKSGIKTVTLTDLSEEMQQANRTKRNFINQSITIANDKKTKEKLAEFAYLLFSITDNSVLENEDIEISAITGSLCKASKKEPFNFSEGFESFSAITNPAIKFRIKNKTSHTIYIDLGNTFYTRFGQSLCYYVPTSTTTSSSSTTGGSVALGAIAGAAGIGGTIGKLANGVSVGGGNTNVTSSTTYSQRVIAVAPMSTYETEPKSIFADEAKSLTKGIYYDQQAGLSYLFNAYMVFPKDSPLKDGYEYSYTQETSPIQSSFMVTYSNSEDCISSKSLFSSYYVKNIIGNRFNIWNGSSNTKLVCEDKDKLIGCLCHIVHKKQ